MLQRVYLRASVSLNHFNLCCWTSPPGLHLYPTRPTENRNHCCLSCPLTDAAFLYLITPSFYVLTFVVMALSCLSTYEAVIVSCLLSGFVVTCFLVLERFSPKHISVYFDPLSVCKLYFGSLVMKCALTK